MANASDGGNRTNPSVRKPTVSEIRAVTAALAERAPANAATGIRLGEDYDGSQMPLSVDQIVPYNMKHNAESEACDLLMEVEKLDRLMVHVDEN